MTQYVHNTYHDGRGHVRSRSWHIVRAPLAHARFYVTFCGRTVVSDDLMDETPSAATCESCYRAKARADEFSADEAEAMQLPETKTDPAGEDDPAMPFEPTVTST